MDFVELTKQVSRDLYDSCDRGALQRLGREMERAKGIQGLLENDSPALAPFPRDRLCELAEVYRAFVRWKKKVREVRRVLSASGLSIPDGSLQNAATPHELSALERTARMCQRSGYPDHESWFQAFLAHLDLWRACVALGLSEGTATIKALDPGDPEAVEFTGLVATRVGLADIRGYQWLGARRGERAGMLSIEIDLPAEAIQDQAEARLPSLGLVAQKRGESSILEELVLSELKPTVVKLVDQRAESEALHLACLAYVGLLDTPPLKADRILSVYISSAKAPAGIALMGGDGELIEPFEVPSGRALSNELEKLISEHEPDAAVLPTSSRDSDRLMEALNAVKDLSVVRVYRACVREASAGMPYSKPVAGAMVMGKRALFPVNEWTKVPPASLGLGEYTGELDSNRLSEALDEARLASLWEKRNAGRHPPKRGSIPGQGGAVYRRLNPLVRTIHDLKPGMLLNGVVTNLTHFGAFVNIGISKEAMIHISQLSTEFVDDPSQVVRVGQTVSARVLEVAPEKNRIALTLKDDAPRESLSERLLSGAGSDLSPGTPSGPKNERRADSPPGGRKAAQKGKERNLSRSDALSELNALFKKQ